MKTTEDLKQNIESVSQKKLTLSSTDENKQSSMHVSFTDISQEIKNNGFESCFVNGIPSHLQVDDTSFKNLLNLYVDAHSKLKQYLSNFGQKETFDPFGRKSSFDTMDYVAYCCEVEGLDYCFISYSNFSDVRDNQFQELRSKYVHARETLDNYIKRHEN